MRSGVISESVRVHRPCGKMPPRGLPSVRPVRPLALASPSCPTARPLRSRSPWHFHALALAGPTGRKPLPGCRHRSRGLAWARPCSAWRSGGDCRRLSSSAPALCVSATSSSAHAVLPLSRAPRVRQCALPLWLAPGGWSLSSSRCRAARGSLDPQLLQHCCKYFLVRLGSRDIFTQAKPSRYRTDTEDRSGVPPGRAMSAGFPSSLMLSRPSHILASIVPFFPQMLHFEFPDILCSGVSHCA